MNLTIENTIDRVRLLLRKDKEPYLRLYNIMGFYPHDLSLYRVALMHRSTTSTNRKMRHVNNERLEFLGDAILGAVVADIVYDRYRKEQEGFLTTLRSKIVKRETLNDLAVKIGLDKLVIHSERMVAAHNNYMNGNAFEAFMGAIYLDRGYDYCMFFMKERILQNFIDIDRMSTKEENYKSKIIEWCQHYQCLFDFVVTDEKMEAGNAPKFFAEVRIEGVVCGKGAGYSKKESHQSASLQAYRKVQSDVKFVNGLIDKRNQRVNAKNEVKPQEQQQRPVKEPQPVKESKPAKESQPVKEPKPAKEPQPKQPSQQQPQQSPQPEVKAEAKKPKRKVKEASDVKEKPVNEPKPAKEPKQAKEAKAAKEPQPVKEDKPAKEGKPAKESKSVKKAQAVVEEAVPVAEEAAPRKPRRRSSAAKKPKVIPEE